MKDMGKFAYEAYTSYLLDRYDTQSDSWDNLPIEEQNAWREVAHRIIQEVRG